MNFDQIWNLIEVSSVGWAAALKKSVAYIWKYSQQIIPRFITLGLIELFASSLLNSLKLSDAYMRQ